MVEVFVWRHVLYVKYIQSLPRSIQKSQPSTRRPPRKVDSAESRGDVWGRGNATARLVQLSQPGGAKMRRRPYTVRVGDRYKVKYYKGEVSIALVSVLDIMPLAIIHTVIYIYSKWLRIRCFIS